MLNKRFIKKISIPFMSFCKRAEFNTLCNEITNVSQKKIKVSINIIVQQNVKTVEYNRDSKPHEFSER